MVKISVEKSSMTPSIKPYLELNFYNFYLKGGKDSVSTASLSNLRHYRICDFFFVNLREFIITWEKDLWSCLWRIFLVILIALIISGCGSLL